MTTLLRHETTCFKPRRSGFTDLGSMPGQYIIMNVPVPYHGVDMVMGINH